MTGGLKRFTIALAGNFGPDRTEEKIQGWIAAHGGIFASDISSNVTHLVCSLKAYKQSVPTGGPSSEQGDILLELIRPVPVRKALDVETIKIVTFDWLEESLLDGNAKRAKPYLVRRVIRQRRVRKDARRFKRKQILRENGTSTPPPSLVGTNVREVAKFKQDCKSFQEHMQAGQVPWLCFRPRLISGFTEGYGIYRDEGGFPYNVTLARVDLATNTNERYHLKVGHLPTPIYPYYCPRRSRVRLDRPPTQQLQLFQTHEIPRRYACYTVYASRDGVSSGHVLAPPYSSFELALSQFEQFFKMKTYLDWRDRFEKVPNNIVGPDGKPLPPAFRYAIPNRWHDPRRPAVGW